jgi:hypothetical protein
VISGSYSLFGRMLTVTALDDAKSVRRSAAAGQKFWRVWR